MKAVLFATALLALGAASTHAATITVNSAADSVADDGVCTLREAVIAANTNTASGATPGECAAGSPGADTINFAANVAGATIVLTSGQIQITDALTITGSGQQINGNGTNRIFQIVEAGGGNCPVSGSDFLVSLSGLGLTNGQRHTDNSGGAIQTFKSLSLSGVAVYGNIAKSGGGVSFLTQYAGQSLSITNSFFLSNFAQPLSAVTSAQEGGAVRITENCFDNTTHTINKTIPVTVTIANTLFSGNRAKPVTGTGRQGSGGAIGSYAYADISIQDSRIVDNHVDVPTPDDLTLSYQGGAFRGYAKSLTLTRVEVSDNSVFDATANNLTRGGGLFLVNAAPNLQTAPDVMTVKIVDSTISGNRVTDTAGAMWVNGNVAVELDNTTISDNVSAPGRTGGIVVIAGNTDCVPTPCPISSSPTLTMASSIVANSLPPGSADLAGNAASIPTFTVNADRSLIESICAPSATCSTITVSGSGNLTATDPMLDPLDFNGGRTRTHWPQSGSPVIDAGSNPLALATDQRGAPRVVGSATDMGAFETPVLPALRGLVPDGTSLTQTFGPYPDTKWFALVVEPGKTYVIEAADVSGDLGANAIGTLGLLDVDFASAPAEASVDCTTANGPRPPAVDVNSDGIRCILRTKPPTFGSFLNQRAVVVKATRMDPALGGGSQFRIRAREATVYGRWVVTNGFDYHVEVENTTANAMCVEGALYPASGLTYNPYVGWSGGVGIVTVNVPAFGAVKRVTPAGTKVGNNMEGTFRIGACASPVELIPGALHVSSYAFNQVTNTYIYYFTSTANDGKTRSSW